MPKRPEMDKKNEGYAFYCGSSDPQMSLTPTTGCQVTCLLS
jgi:hypothetical protein